MRGAARRVGRVGGRQPRRPPSHGTLMAIWATRARSLITGNTSLMANGEEQEHAAGADDIGHAVHLISRQAGRQHSYPSRHDD